MRTYKTVVSGRQGLWLVVAGALVLSIGTVSSGQLLPRRASKRAAEPRVSTPVAPVSGDEAQAIAADAYVYFYPLVTMDVTRRQMTNLESGKKPGFGPMNAFHHVREYPPADMKVVVRPNFDTLYSIAWVDLTRGPMILSLPDTAGRYYLMPLLDMWTDAFAVPGRRTTGTQAGHYAVVLQGWRGALPQGVERIDAPTPYVWIIGRTQTNGPGDYAAVNKVQDGYTLTPLAEWGGAQRTSRETFTPDPTVDMKTPPMEQVNAMSGAAYFKYAAELLKLHPPHVADWSIVARLKRIGIEPGKGLDFDKLAPAVRNALEKAPASGLKLMQWKAPTLARQANGWSMNTDTMGVYGDYYLKRAIVTMVGLGANPPEDAIYPMCVGDAEGKPLSGDNKYVLHFSKEELPPVGAFWSVTMYDVAGYQVANPINRFAVSSWMPFAYNADGSLDLYLQRDNPGAGKEANWLPAGTGPMSVLMRLYAPKAEALNGRWNPPAVKKAAQ
jgi:hypothetical protein